MPLTPLLVTAPVIATELLDVDHATSLAHLVVLQGWVVRMRLSLVKGTTAHRSHQSFELDTVMNRGAHFDIPFHQQSTLLFTVGELRFEEVFHGPSLALEEYKLPFEALTQAELVV